MNKLTYKEAADNLKLMGYFVAHSGDFYVYTDDKIGYIDHTNICVRVSATKPYYYGIDFDVFEQFPEKDRAKILGIIYALAMTPLKDRGIPKYYLKIKPRYNHLFPGGETYINYHRKDNYILLSDKREELSWQTKFTTEECTELEKKYDLTILERVLVEED